MIDKIRKLLAKARDKGVSEAEASLYLEKAHALMRKYNLTAAQVEEADDSITIVRGKTHSGMSHKWKDILCFATSHLFHVSPVWGPDGSTMVFVGRRMDVEAAEATLEYLVDQVNGLYKQKLQRGWSTKERSEYRRTFKHACALRVHDRIAELLRQPSANALVLYDAKTAEAISAALDSLGAKSREVALQPRTIGSGTGEGFMQGGSVNLRRPL